VPGYAFWIGDEAHVFTATVGQPNGASDQYTENDSFSTHFNMPDLFDIPVITVLKTNNMAYRYKMEIRDIDGNVILTRDLLDNNTIYRDTLDLPFGCYTIEITDAEDMGLTYWAYPEQGSGYFRLLDLDGNILKSFNSDFGRSIHYTYNVGEGFYVQEPGFDRLVSIYPNPTEGMVYLDMNDIRGKVSVNIYDMQGALIRRVQENSSDGQLLSLDLSDCPPGMYLVEVIHSSFSVRKKIIRN
jgi:hypothetical protein